LHFTKWDLSEHFKRIGIMENNMTGGIIGGTDFSLSKFYLIGFVILGITAGIIHYFYSTWKYLWLFNAIVPIIAILLVAGMVLSLLQSSLISSAGAI
jgi:hypothetical protein